MSDENTQTAGDTVDDIGDALKKDADATVEDSKDAADWVEDKAEDAGNKVENEAEEHGLNSGDPSNDND